MKLKEKFHPSVLETAIDVANAEEESQHSASDVRRGAIGA